MTTYVTAVTPNLHVFDHVTPVPGNVMNDSHFVYMWGILATFYTIYLFIYRRLIRYFFGLVFHVTHISSYYNKIEKNLYRLSTYSLYIYIIPFLHLNYLSRFFTVS